MKHDELFPPAAVKPDMDWLKSEITKTLKEAYFHSEQSALYFRKVGQLFLRAKEAVGHGNFGDFVRSTFNVSERQVQRWMKLAQTDPSLDQDQQWKIINGHYEEELPNLTPSLENKEFGSQIRRCASDLSLCPRYQLGARRAARHRGGTRKAAAGGGSIRACL